MNITSLKLLYQQIHTKKAELLVQQGNLQLKINKINQNIAVLEDEIKKQATRQINITDVNILKLSHHYFSTIDNQLKIAHREKNTLLHEHAVLMKNTVEHYQKEKIYQKLIDKALSDIAAKNERKERKEIDDLVASRFYNTRVNTTD